MLHFVNKHMDGKYLIWSDLCMYNYICVQDLYMPYIALSFYYNCRKTRQLVYFAKNKNNLLVQLVGPTSNYISTFIIHSVIYYYFN
jgi:hypothetical protein